MFNFPFTLNIFRMAHRVIELLFMTIYRVDDRNVAVKQFVVMDPDGYLIRFAQDIGSRPI